MSKKFVYVLLSDGDRTTHSIPTPFGVAVTTEKEAKRFVKEDKDFNSYAKVRVFDDADEGVEWAFSKDGPEYV